MSVRGSELLAACEILPGTLKALTLTLTLEGDRRTCRLSSRCGLLSMAPWPNPAAAAVVAMRPAEDAAARGWSRCWAPGSAGQRRALSPALSPHFLGVMWHRHSLCTSSKWDRGADHCCATGSLGRTARQTVIPADCSRLCACTCDSKGHVLLIVPKLSSGQPRLTP